jgi:hypothetical protein
LTKYLRATGGEYEMTVIMIRNKPAARAAGPSSIGIVAFPTPSDQKSVRDLVQALY